jgi:hypothetical protein
VHYSSTAVSYSEREKRICSSRENVPIRIAEGELGLRVGIVNPHPPAFRSRALKATFDKQLRGSVLADCQLPDVIEDRGRQIRKPLDW